MAEAWEALRLALLWAGWPGLIAVSSFALLRAHAFYRGLKHSAPGQLVYLMVIGWIVTLGGMALLSTMYLQQAPAQAGPIVLPVFVVWAGTLIVIVYVVQRWGHEAATLDAYYGELEKMERMKSGFINHVAHELNTPITPLRMQLAALRTGSLGPVTDKQESALARMRRNLDRLAALVEEVVLASFIQSGAVDLYKRPTDLHRLVEEAAEAAKDDDGPEIVVTADAQVEASVDRDRLGYALQAFLSHATRLQEGEGPVEVDVARLEGSARVAIRYDGKPLTGRAFDLFADPIRLGNGEGIGIDLFNAQGIIALHGGQVLAGHGSGSEVVAVIPVGAMADPVAAALHATGPRADPAT